MMSLITWFARRWIAGLTLPHALDVVEKLNRRGFLTTLDHLGEDVTNEKEANVSTEQYIAILRALKERGLDRNVSIKLTQLGLAIDPDLCAKNLGRIVSASSPLGLVCHTHRDSFYFRRDIRVWHRDVRLSFDYALF